MTRDAVPGDNEALMALAAACPMEGEMTLCVERAPDFFALNRLEGDRWRVGVVDDGAAGAAGALAGCVAVTERCAYLHGRPAQTLYLSDLKVHPAHRGAGVADALSRYCREAVRAVGGERAPTLVTVLAGNARMERRARGPRGLPTLTRFATLRAHAVGLLWRRPPPTAPDLAVSRAELRDLEEMAALWARVAPGRQFAPVLDAAGLARWIAAAPGLDLSCYFIARRGDGRLAGFFALWDQSVLKQLRVLRYAPRAAAFRVAFNVAAPLVGAPRLPPPGATLRYLTAVHVCVPAEEPAVLRALLIHAYNETRGPRGGGAGGGGYAFFTVGLDERDPLSAALAGLLAQATRIGAYVTTPAGRYTGPSLDDRPLHYEIALV